MDQNGFLLRGLQVRILLGSPAKHPTKAPEKVTDWFRTVGKRLFQRCQSARSPQQEGETLLASPHGIHACANEIADRFMNRIRNPDRSEIADAMLQGEFLRVPSVRL